MFRVFLCISTQHSWTLVLLAALVCVLATFATFFLFAKTPIFPAWRRWAWLAMTGLVSGSGIWTTHFVAMLAFKTGLPTGYAVTPIVASLVVAIASTTLGFALAAARFDRTYRGSASIAGGLVIGFGITAMHYVGMSGYRTTGVLQWDRSYVLASVLIGAAASAAALFVAKPISSYRRLAASSGLLTLGIVGMHFTGMSAVSILPDASVTVPASLMSAAMMVTLAIASTSVILITAIGGVAFDAASRNGNLTRLRQALDVIPDALAFYDASDRLVAWNTQYADFFRQYGTTLVAGASFSDLIQANLVHGAYPDALGREQAWLRERDAVHHGLVPSLTQLTASGRWLRITDRRTADGGTVSVSVDVTDLKRAEAEMAAARDHAEEQARRAEFAEDLARLGNWRLEAATGRITWSAQMYDIYGLEPDATLDLEQLMLMTHAEDVDDAVACVQSKMEGGPPQATSVRILRADGQVRHIASNTCAEVDAAGVVVAVVGTVVDVTEQKLLEAQLRQAQSEAEAAAAVKSEFLANMSHELRTPLTSIIGFTGLAVEQPDLSPQTRHYIERVGDASRALLCSVNDILDFSKLEAGQVTFHPEPMEPARLGRATLELFTPQAGAKDLDLHLEIEDKALVVALDPDRIRQILLNLVGNAVKFTERGGVTLSIRFDDSAQVLQIDVSDTGAGIPEERLGLLFKRFSQVDGSLTRSQGGTGLGLAICKGLVEAMGGEIGVDSRPGRGSRFWLKIPAQRASLGDADSADRDGGHRASFGGLRILVVDDHPANRELARLFLTGAGAEVTLGSDGEEGVQLAADWPYDVILMDLKMPVLDGRGAMERIRRSRGPNEATPILAFSASADMKTAGYLVAAGFDGIVSKPLEPAALIDAVAKAAAFDPMQRLPETADVH